MELPSALKKTRYGLLNARRKIAKTLGLFLLLYSFGLNKAEAYCGSFLGGDTSPSIDTIKILGTTLNNGTPGAAPSFYTMYPVTGNTTASLTQGATYTLHARFGSAAISSMWIDYDQNGLYDSYEWTQVTTNAITNDITFTVPINASVGLTGLRIRTNDPSESSDPNSACDYYGWGETEDYVITIALAPPCTGTPTAGTTTATATSVCYNNTATLSLSGASANSGLSYEWQVYNGTAWVAVTGGTGATAFQYTSFPLTTDTQFRCKVICTAGPSPAVYSTPVTIAVNMGTLPYLEDFESIANDYDLPHCMTATNMGYPTFTATSPQWPNLDNHTNGGSNFGGFYSSANDYFFTDALKLVAGETYRFSFWYQTDGFTGWTQIQGAVGTAADPTAMTFIGNPVNDATNTNYKQYIAEFTAPTTDVYYFGVYCNATWNPSAMAIDDIGVVHLPPCSNTPSAGTITPSGPIVGCPGSAYELTTTGTTAATGLVYQWIQSGNNGVWQNAAGTGANTYNFTTPAMSDTLHYRMTVTCTASNQHDTTPEVVIYVPRMTYAPLPFTEGFENWSDRCSTADIPSNYWTNQPVDGNNSWRRNDQGATANWGSPSYGAYTPTSIEGDHSARFSTANAGNPMIGTLDMYVDCSTIPGNKELEFYYHNDDGADSLYLYYSVDSGANFALLGGYDISNNGWDYKTVAINTNSPKVIVRFVGKSDQYGSTDIGIDNVRIVPPCNGTPTAGDVVTVMPCENIDFTLQLQNYPLSSGITYQWQQSPDGINYANMPNGNVMYMTANISQPLYFRCIVTCTASGLSDTSTAMYAQLAPFYFCYCSSHADYDGDEDIGNVTLTSQPGGGVLLNNGVGSPVEFNPDATNVYTDFRHTINPVPLYMDSSYNLSVTQISQNYFYQSMAGAFIDFNRNGIFEMNEQVLTGVTDIGTTPPGEVNNTFVVPDTAQLGITGMRVIISDGTFSTINPCGTYYEGETEDYLVELFYPKCDGPVNPGLAHISDTGMCPGYSFLLTDTSHEKHNTGTAWIWQESTDQGATWADISGSNNHDTLTQLFTGPSWFRMKMLCTFGGDSTFSNIVHVSLKPPYKCYCYSIAVGGNNDTSDIGAFSIGNFVMQNGGPHLKNGAAVRGRTDNTDLGPIELYVDSTYQISAYHILRSNTHADAKITLFMDFNNNLQYDIPSEHLWTAITGPQNWYLTTSVTIPQSVITDVPTGMRIILNNNTGANSPSDDACGGYVSGETEDYTVIFRSLLSTGIGGAQNLQNLMIYPNPTTGKFTVRFNASKALDDVQVQVTNITGQQIMLKEYKNVSQEFSDQIDLGDRARGIYFVEIIADGQKTINKVILR